MLLNMLANVEKEKRGEGDVQDLVSSTTITTLRFNKDWKQYIKDYADKR